MGRTAPTMKTSRRPLGVDEDACMVAYEVEEEARKGRTKGSFDTTRQKLGRNRSDATFNANTMKKWGGMAADPRCQWQLLTRGGKGALTILM